MGVINYSNYNGRVKRFLKYLDRRPWQIDTISDQEDEKIRAEFLKIFRPKKKKKKVILNNPEDCKHKDAYHFHDNAPAYCPDCDTYPKSILG